MDNPFSWYTEEGRQFVLHHKDDMTAEEISDHLNITVETVKDILRGATTENQAWKAWAINNRKSKP
jgi:DNA-directed RNA polymerase specialized sigma24 family protein